MRRRVDLPDGPREAARGAASGLRGYWSFVCDALTSPTAQTVGWLVGIASALASALSN